MIFFILFITIIIIIVFYKLYNVKYLSKDETKKYLEHDSDSYFHNFSECDKKARSINNINEYLNKIEPYEFTLKQKIKIYICILKANSFFKSSFTLNNYNLDYKTLIDEKWNIALTKSKSYENGYPHTRNDVIFLSTDTINRSYDELTSILIHEKIHIDQKLHKSKYDDIIHNVMKLKKINESRLKLNGRANPDIDDNIYVDESNSITYIATYNNTCNNINDINVYNNNVKYEHPYEEIAYNIESLYLYKT
jgi:predicted metal-dependent hydrolase